MKCEDFLKNSKQHFEDTKIINFNIIRREARDEKVPDGVLKKYHTLQDSRDSQYPKKGRYNFLSSAFSTQRSDIYFGKKTLTDHFKK